MSNIIVTSSPHITDKRTTRSIMADVIIALVPAMIASIILFGFRALLVLIVTVAACVIGEYVTRRILKRPNSLGDLTAVITGVLLALNLPASLPLWMAAVGGLIAIIVVKQLFGGVGYNFVNPAIAGRIVLLVSFSQYMSNWTEPLAWLGGTTADTVSAATPLAIMEAGGDLPSLLDMFLGIRAGSMGETSILALIIGGIYLCIRRVITPVIPVCFIGATVILTTIGGGNPLYEFMSGGLVLGAIFMATDYTTSPMNVKGQIVFGIGCGVITAVIRLFASLPEGVSYSILLMNILVPHIENITMPKPFGTKEAAANESK